MVAHVANEAQLLGMLLEAFPYAYPRLMIFRRNIVNVEAKKGFRARAGIKGQADAYVMGSCVHVEVETKAATHRWYKEQLAWRARCVALGIPYLVARALRDEPPSDTVARWLSEIGALAGHTRC